MPDYNPNSSDAQFSKILQILEDQNRHFEEKKCADKEAFEKIIARQDVANGRTNKLEKKLAYLRGKAIGIAAVTSIVITIVGWWASK